MGTENCKYTFALSEVPYQGDPNRPVVLMAFYPKALATVIRFNSCEY